jgi:hypothetical protein
LAACPVTTPTGTSATVAADHFTFSLPPVPSVTGVSPNTGTTAGGPTVYVSGSGFTSATGVTFGTTTANYRVLSDTLLSATVPPAPAGTVDVTVVNYGGSSSHGSADHFIYTAAPVPSVTQVTPTSGPIAGGTTVTVVGSNFTGATAVHFGGLTASYSINSDTSITTTAPAHAAGTVDIVVLAYSGSSDTSSADQFTYS